MLASKSDEDGPGFDTFCCLKCETVISFAVPPRSSKPDC